MKPDKDTQLHQQTTVFGIPKHSQVVFCIDASTRLQEVLRIIFQHLIAHLLQMDKMFNSSKFNVVLYAEKNEKPLQSVILKISKKHDLSIFLVSRQLPPVDGCLKMFCAMAADNEDYVGAITLITTKKQAENMKLTAFSLSSTEFASGDADDDPEENLEKKQEDMQKWLDDQAILVSGSAAGSPPVPRVQKVTHHIRPSSRKGSRDRRQRRSQRPTGRSSSREGDPDYKRKSSQRPTGRSSSREDDPDYKRKSSQRPTGRSSSREGDPDYKRKSSQRQADQTGSRIKAIDNGRKMYDRKGSRSRQSRSSSPDYNYKRSIRPVSVQSSARSIDSAGSLLLGRHVLAPRRDHENRLFLGVVKTQKKDRCFGVVFCIPFVAHGDGEDEDHANMEYCLQDVGVENIISYSDVYRHAVAEKDDVLVPAMFLEPPETKRKRGTDLAQLEPPYAGQPYVLAIVHKGFEPRSSRDSGSPGRKTSSLLVKVAANTSRGLRLCEIPTGCALWIPEKLARRLYAQGCNFFDSRGAPETSPSHLREQKDSLCMHGPAGRLLDGGGGEAGLPSCKCSDSLRHSVDSETSMSLSAAGARRRGRSSDGYRRHDIESANSDGSLSSVEKRSQSSSRRSGSGSAKTKKPSWQYWGKAEIPTLIDPPTHEPYIAPQTFGPGIISNTSVSGEWPAAHFLVVNHSVDNTTAQNDSSRVYEAMRQIQNPPPLLKSPDLYLTRSQKMVGEDGNFDHLLEASYDGSEEGLAGVALRDLYRRRLIKNLRDAKLNSSANSSRDRFHSRPPVAKSVQSQ